MSRLAHFKSSIKTKYPTFFSFLKQIQKLPYRFKTRDTIFSEIYKNNRFRGDESISGPGSNLVQTSVIREEIPRLLKEINAKSLLDAPCGDFYWMKEVNLNLDQYIGADIVPDLIAQNQEKYESKNRKFMTLDITKDDLPQVDLILCRDCLIHLSFKDCISAIRNFQKSNPTAHLLTTTYIRESENRDIITGRYRPINLQLPPFNFPKPIKLIDEGCTEEDSQYSDKNLGLWKLDEISL